MARVSVIMPAYNASQTIGRALESLRNQTYQDIEIIIINDGSTDETLEVVQEIARLDSRIVIVNQSNSGPGFARNAGLNKAGGEFVYFMDSDDTIDADLINKCVAYMIDSDLDLLVFGFAIIDEFAVEGENVSFDDNLAINKEELALAYVLNFLMPKHGNGFLWNKFYRRDIIEENSIRFGDDNIMEDELFNIDYYCHISRCRFVEDVLYNYYWTTSTSIRSKYNPTYLCSLKKVYNAFMTLKADLRINDVLFDDIVINRTWKGVVIHLFYNLYISEPHLSMRDVVRSFKVVSSDSFFQNVNNKQNKQRLANLSTIEKLLHYSISMDSALVYMLTLKMYRGLKRIKSLIGKHV